MDVFEMGRAIRRRTALVLAIVITTVGLAVAAHVVTPAIYDAHGSVVLEPPSASASDDAASALDLVGLSDRLDDETGAEVPMFTLSRQSSGDYRLAVVGPSSTAARDAMSAFIDRLGSQVAAAQEDASIPGLERVALVESSRRVASEPAEDGSVSIIAGLTLRDPARVRLNPFGADDVTGRRIALAVSGDAGHERFREEVGPGVDFTVGQEAGDPIALLDVETTSADPTRSVEAFDVVVSMLVDELRQQQDDAGVLARQQVRLTVVEEAQEAKYMSPPVKRPTVVVLVLGGLAAVLVPLVLESRRRREASEPVGRSTAGPTKDGDAHRPNHVHAFAGGPDHV